MAVLQIPDERRTITETGAVTEYLSGIGITHERWEAPLPLPRDASSEEVLAAYASEVERLKQERGYAAADVITAGPLTPGLGEMLARFKREHWHDEDEVRFIVGGRGLFHVRPASGPVVVIEVATGDLICLPAGVRHWFNLCSDLEIKAIRLFERADGWVPYYTESDVDLGYEPVCLGTSYFPPDRREHA
jgi:1,2-dihydroxy-3-keto-5-methylthiopentene dioxygenase